MTPFDKAQILQTARKSTKILKLLAAASAPSLVFAFLALDENETNITCIKYGQ